MPEIIIKVVDGEIKGILHPAESSGGIIWLCGALGGLDGPSFGIFKTLAEELNTAKINSLRLHYAHPGDFEKCVRDTRLGITYLLERNINKIILVGHSFGGAVAIQAGVESDPVLAVVSLAGQTYGAQNVTALSPRPLLLIHGERDRNLPARCSELIYSWAREPKKLVILPNNGHFLREDHEWLQQFLSQWLKEKFKKNAPVHSRSR